MQINKRLKRGKVGTEFEQGADSGRGGVGEGWRPRHFERFAFMIGENAKVSVVKR